MSYVSGTIRAMSPEKAKRVLEMFVLRARRVREHSLVKTQAQLLARLGRGDTTFRVEQNIKTGESKTYLVQDFPDEEAMESLATRVRPFTLGDTEDVSYGNVLDAIKELATEADIAAASVEPLSWFDDMWLKTAGRKHPDPQAMTIITGQGEVTDLQLMFAWMYYDVVHMDRKEVKTAIGLSVGERYRAAAPVVARIVALAIKTLKLVTALHKSGAISLDPAVFETAVTVAEPSREIEAEVSHAPVGTPPPADLDDLDPAVWTPLPLAADPS
jgi:hypothetical protein